MTSSRAIRLILSLYTRQITVEPKIWNSNKNGFSICEMVFDTGACMTTISTQLALRSGYSLKGAPTTTIDGVGSNDVPVSVIVIPQFMIGDINIGSVSAYVTDMVDTAGNAKQTQALLGMNVIRHFNFAVSFAAKYDAKGKKLYDGEVKLYPTFDLSDIPDTNNFMAEQSRFGLWSVTQGI